MFYHALLILTDVIFIRPCAKYVPPYVEPPAAPEFPAFVPPAMAAMPPAFAYPVRWCRLYR